MGQRPNDIAREIEGIRKESDLIVDELQRRATLPHMARGITSTVTDRAEALVNEASSTVTGAASGAASRVTGAASGAASRVTEATSSMPEPVRSHPYMSTAAGAAVIALAGALAIPRLIRSRRKSTREKLMDRASSTMDMAGDIAAPYIERAVAMAKPAIGRASKVGKKMSEAGSNAKPYVGKAGETIQEVTDQIQKRAGRIQEKGGSIRVTRRSGNTGMLKRVLWVAVASGMATLGSMLFKRMTEGAWRTTMHEEPPK